MLHKGPGHNMKVQGIFISSFFHYFKLFHISFKLLLLFYLLANNENFFIFSSYNNLLRINNIKLSIKLIL